MAAKKRYTAPVRYSAEELLVAEIADLYTDIRCALRDGRAEYAAAVQEQIDKHKELHPNEVVKGAKMAIRWENP